MLIELPAIVCGRLVTCRERDEVRITEDDGVNIHIPLLTEDDATKICASRLATGLPEMHLDDISIAFKQLSDFVVAPDNPLRDEAVRYCSMVTGYAENVVLRDYCLLAALYANRGEIYDQLDTELGNRWYVDEWLPTQTCLVHAQPVGLVTNILVGNIPVASAFGVLRPLVVKNNVVCKLPRRDPVSALYYGLFLREALGEDHPLVQSITVGYWERNSIVEEHLLTNSDAVCIWGGERALSEVKRKIGCGTRILEYGPKRSICMVDLTALDRGDTLDRVARRAAHDFSVYNQEACFAAQELFLVADDDSFEEFLSSFERGLDHFLDVHPKGQIMIDNKAHVLLTRLEQQLLGERVDSTPDHGWTVVLKSDGDRIDNHPLSRTVFIHRVSSLNEAVDSVTKQTQTVTLYPWKLNYALRDILTLRGADRIAGLGMSNYPRTGFPHDGIYTLNQLVRWVSVERDIDFKGKYYDKNAEEFHEMLFEQHMVHGPQLPRSSITKNEDLIGSDRSGG
jgi:long-chain-fatty-acyl-CoA reductase